MMFLLANTATAHCGTGPSYQDTVDFIKDTMATGTSAFRQERYDSIKFNKCLLDYSVSGTYPVGGSYTMTFRGVDFSRLISEKSKRSHDYTPFVELGFDKEIEFKAKNESKPDIERLRITTVVVNVSDDEASKGLLEAFLHLGELCRNNAELR